MSPRAAWRLESFGFTDVYDYAAGKLDWLAAGLPTEGTNAERPRAADVARRDVPTCHLEEGLGDVQDLPQVERQQNGRSEPPGLPARGLSLSKDAGRRVSERGFEPRRAYRPLGPQPTRVPDV